LPEPDGEEDHRVGTEVGETIVTDKDHEVLPVLYRAAEQRSAFGSPGRGRAEERDKWYARGPVFILEDTIPML
jgi:hypothetical protein